MTVRSSEADSEIVDEEDDRGLGLEADPAGFTDRGLGKNPPKVEYFYFSDSRPILPGFSHINPINMRNNKSACYI